jgi:plasmid stabilization system protein ParE
MPKPVFHPEAAQEYSTTFYWYQGRSERAARRFEQEVERALREIIANPLSFPGIR